MSHGPQDAPGGEPFTRRHEDLQVGLHPPPPYEAQPSYGMPTTHQAPFLHQAPYLHQGSSPLPVSPQQPYSPEDFAPAYPAEQYDQYGLTPSPV
ncbi:MAG TPA: hypothetical protein VFO77_12515, partial [Actinoplanes sp.]|nr:hypothetical protein [Actinoplanes sp.]